MTAFQSMMLLSVGAPLTPTGGSSCSLLKSRMRRRLAGVDIFFLSEFIYVCDLQKASETKKKVARNRQVEKIFKIYTKKNIKNSGLLMKMSNILMF
jgi:hypothetical protein